MGVCSGVQVLGVLHGKEWAYVHGKEWAYVQVLGAYVQVLGVLHGKEWAYVQF